MTSWIYSIREADAADWITVAGYLAAAACAFGASKRSHAYDPASEGLFWRATTLGLIALAVNEILDLQTLLTLAGRAYAKSNGWYGRHRPVQYLFVVSLAAFSVLFGVIVLWYTRKADRYVRSGLIGLGFIGLFVLLRAASFHHLDDWLGSGVREFTWGSVQEMAGIVIVGSSAFKYRRRME